MQINQQQINQQAIDTRPRFRMEVEGWLDVKVDGGAKGRRYVILRNGVVSVYEDNTLEAPLASASLSECTISELVEGELKCTITQELLKQLPEYPPVHKYEY